MKKSKRINLRKAYNASGSKSDYARWIRNKVEPVIGRNALRNIPSKPGSKVLEWSVTERNMGRVCKSLGLSISNSRPRVTKIVESLGTDLTTELILTLISKIPKPAAKKNEIVYIIPLHGFSNNYQYKDIGPDKKVCTAAYTKWKKTGDSIMETLITPEDFNKINFDDKIHLDLHFKHVPTMDTTNLIKSAQDLIFRSLGKNDNVVKSCSVTGEDARNYSDGHIIAKMRNI